MATSEGTGLVPVDHEDLLNVSLALERMLKKQTTVEDIRKMPSGKRFLQQLTMFRQVLMREMIQHHVAKVEDATVKPVKNVGARYWKKRKRLDEYMINHLSKLHPDAFPPPRKLTKNGTLDNGSVAATASADEPVQSGASATSAASEPMESADTKFALTGYTVVNEAGKSGYLKRNNTRHGQVLLQKEQEAQKDAQQEKEQGKVKSVSKCYICKVRLPEPSNGNNKRHPSNITMCIPCGNLNEAKRTQTCNGKGKIALVTGGRIKIGFQIVLSLLRNGFTVLATTRFVADAERRYKEEKDYDVWKTRLTLLAADLRNPDYVMQLCRVVQKHTSVLDVMILNAAQTDRKPADYYVPLLTLQTREAATAAAVSANKEFSTTMAASSAATAASTFATALVPATFPTALAPADAAAMAIASAGTRTRLNPVSIATFATQALIPEDVLSKEQMTKWFPAGKKDSNGEQLDLRPETSWNLKFDKIHPIELLETLMVNLFAPLLMTQQLLPLMSHQKQHTCLIMVSSVEGQFYTRAKNGDGAHAHTNAAKSGLHMLVRSLGLSFWDEYKVSMNAVDTGWVSAMHPQKRADATFQPPLDNIDGAARVLDPVYQSFSFPNTQPICGVLWKDYKVATW